MQNLSYTALEKLEIPKPVNRIDYLCQAAKNNHILDLGALDETAYLVKKNSEHWVHKRLAQEASFVRGVDISDLIANESLKPFENSTIEYGDVYNLEPIISRFGAPDLIVAGELIEHLPNSLKFLQNMKEISALNGTRILLTTPNACCIHNAIIGLFRRESTHQDHLAIFSFKTINTLLKRANFESWKCLPYYMKFPEMISKTKGLQKWSTISFEKAVNAGEYLFPTLSGGWIIDAII